MDNTNSAPREHNRFQILNGTWLEGYPLKNQSTEQVENDLKLDSTGEYLVVAGKKEKKPSPKKQTPEELGRIFYTNAFLFWEKRNLIFSDSRMFLARVPVQNGLAYVGRSGFIWPTLGIYLEWWERCEQAHFKNKKEERLIWYISGSPLSGANVCASVSRDGKDKTTPVSPFLLVWSSFAKINRRYDDIKPLYEAYTLEQVLEILNSPTQ